MRTQRKWLKRAGLGVAAGAMLLSPALLPAQEQDRDRPPQAADRQQQEAQPEDADREQQPEAAQGRRQDRQPEADRRERDDRRTFRQPEGQQTERGGREGREQAEDGRAWLGVLLAPNEEGIRVVQVYPGSPADRAGIRAGDLLVGTNGQEFDAPEDVSQAIADEQPGATARFTIERQGREEEIDVELGRRPRAAERGMPGLPGGPDMGGMRREFRGFGPDRQMIQEHRRIQQEHQQLKEQVGELQRELRELRRELNQLRQQRQNGDKENSAENP